MRGQGGGQTPLSITVRLRGGVQYVPRMRIEARRTVHLRTAVNSTQHLLITYLLRVYLLIV